MANSYLISPLAGFVPDGEVPMPRSFGAEALALGATDYAQFLLSCCVTTVIIPTPVFHGVSVAAFRQSLSLPMKRLIKTTDSNSMIWDSFSRYLSPVVDAVASAVDQSDLAQCLWLEEELAIIGKVAWATYITYLATKKGGSVLVDPSVVLRRIGQIRQRHGKLLGSEEMIRLATIEGLFRSVVATTKIPGLRCLPGSAEHLRDRLEEIREDAHLHEASAIRRFFAGRSNIASVRRDLRLLLRTITRKRWAKGLVDLTAHAVGVGEITDKATEALSIPNSQAPGQSPLFLGDQIAFVAANCDRYWVMDTVEIYGGWGPKVA